MDLPLDALSVPFRMRPGLRRLGENARILTPLEAGSPMAAEKQAVFAAGASRLCARGVSSVHALEAIARRAAQEGQQTPLEVFGAPELAFEEDFALIDTQRGCLGWMGICLPSHWAPEDKIGLHFTQIHAPVADNQAILAATQGLLALVGSGACWERYVWSLSPSGRYDQHPTRRARVPWSPNATPEQLLGNTFLRAERQCFFPAPGPAGWAVFSIRVMLEPLTETLARRGWAEQLAASLESMSPAVLDYKGLSPAKDRLLQGLRAYF